MKAIFLDRDGVIINNSAHYYIFKPEDVKFVEGIFKNLNRLKLMGYSFFVVTNQGGISKKLYRIKEVDEVHKIIRNELNKHDLDIIEFIFCPHHDSIETCFCRKPSSLMLEKLIAKYQIDKEHSFFIGDSLNDIEAANGAGIKGVLSPANKNFWPEVSKILSLD